MTKIIQLEEIKGILVNLPTERLIQLQEEGFRAFSNGQVVVPPVGYLGFDDPRGDMHIKYGFIKGDNYYVIKEATSFFENERLYNIPTSNGLMIVCNAKTGQVEGILLDEGYLTDLRTALAGAVVAKHFAPQSVSNIGIIGTGTQARFQLRFLKSIVPIRDVYVWGRNEEKAEEYKEEMEREGFSVRIAGTVNDICENCNLIVTTTPSTEYLISADMVQAGTHITAIGADSEGKQEIDPNLFTKAKFIIADSKVQCVDHGDTSYAIKQNLISEKNIHELGKAIDMNFSIDPKDITIADLTGVACQDIQIAKTIFLAS